MKNNRFCQSYQINLNVIFLRILFCLIFTKQNLFLDLFSLKYGKRKKKNRLKSKDNWDFGLKFVSKGKK